MKTEKKIRWKRLLVIFICLTVLGLLALLGINAHVRRSAAPFFLTPEDAASMNADCVIVLGCGVYDDGSPSPMLRDRLETGIGLYEAGAAPKLLMSGDHGRVQYNEVAVMKRYAMDAAVPSEDVFMDHAGFSTYETMYRARDVFGARRVFVVTQEYHLYRAVYIARALGLEAYGVCADRQTYRGQTMRELREVLARCKDATTSLVKPEPTFLGECIPISGSGDATNDKYWDAAMTPH